LLWQIDPQVPGWLVGDPGRLRQVICHQVHPGVRRYTLVGGLSSRSGFLP
jgi:hypothetical protein